MPIIVRDGKIVGSTRDSKIRTDNSAVIYNLEAKLARYEQALRFYAEKKNYRKVHLNVSHVSADNGETARKALEV